MCICRRREWRGWKSKISFRKHGLRIRYPFFLLYLFNKGGQMDLTYNQQTDLSDEIYSWLINLLSRKEKKNFKILEEKCISGNENESAT